MLLSLRMHDNCLWIVSYFEGFMKISQGQEYIGVLQGCPTLSFWLVIQSETSHRSPWGGAWGHRVALYLWTRFFSFGRKGVGLFLFKHAPSFFFFLKLHEHSNASVQIAAISSIFLHWKDCAPGEGKEKECGVGGGERIESPGGVSVRSRPAPLLQQAGRQSLFGSPLRSVLQHRMPLELRISRSWAFCREQERVREEGDLST